MRPVRVSIPASDDSAPVPLDVYQVAPVTIGISDVSGTVAVDIEATLDDIWDPDVVPVWFDTGLLALAANGAFALVDANDNPIMPTAVRAENGGTGTATLVVIQRGVMG